jgi:hypothetical protein
MKEKAKAKATAKAGAGYGKAGTQRGRAATKESKDNAEAQRTRRSPGNWSRHVKKIKTSRTDRREAQRATEAGVVKCGEFASGGNLRAIVCV